MLKVNSKKGFTIIELLVVIAIMSLLSSIIFASLQNARVNARDALRLSTLVNLRTALSLYYADNGHYPISLEWRDSANFVNTWIPGLAPNYISVLPVEPNSHQTLCLADDPPAPDNNGTGYRYKSDGVTYKLHDHCPPISPAMMTPNHRFAHCPNDDGGDHPNSWSICEGPGCPDIWCTGLGDSL